jgi:G:T-mismatch repair DNA endonuclease (very short patch repair protein)
LREMGWHVEVIWQCEIAGDHEAEAALSRIPSLLICRKPAAGRHPRPEARARR